MAEDMRRASQQPAVRTAPMGTAGEAMMARPQGGSKLPWIVLGVIVVILIVFGVLFRDKLFGKDGGSVKDATTGVDYEAVFLTNGQVYFGQLEGESDQFVTLTDIYYLQVSPSQGSQNTTQANPQDQQGQLTLVKLGKELHGPEDKMKINRDHVLFHEQIEEEGRVMQAIREYQKNPDAANQPQAQPQSQAPAGSAVNGASTGTNSTKTNR